MCQSSRLQNFNFDCTCQFTCVRWIDKYYKTALCRIYNVFGQKDDADRVYSSDIFLFLFLSLSLSLFLYLSFFLIVIILYYTPPNIPLEDRLLELSSANSVGVDAGATYILQWNGFVSGGYTRSGIKLPLVDSNQGRLEKIRMNETVRSWQPRIRLGDCRTRHWNSDWGTTNRELRGYSLSYLFSIRTANFKAIFGFVVCGVVLMSHNWIFNIVKKKLNLFNLQSIRIFILKISEKILTEIGEICCFALWFSNYGVSIWDCITSRQRDACITVISIIYFDIYHRADHKLPHSR